MTPPAARTDGPCAPLPEAPSRVGLMADSHGRADLIEAATAHLRSRGCALCVHLGDIIDTARPDTIHACLACVAARQVTAVRGNNEHTLLLNQSAGVDPFVQEAIGGMPFCRRIGSAFLAHSLPFETELGARCLLDDLDANRLHQFFRSYPGMQLFRGHSHQPEMVWLNQASLCRTRMPPGRPLPLPSGRSAVITCGALADGFCLLWDRQEETVELLSLAAS